MFNEWIKLLEVDEVIPFDEDEDAFSIARLTKFLQKSPRPEAKVALDHLLEIDEWNND